MRRVLCAFTLLVSCLALAQEQPINLQSYVSGGRVHTFQSSFKFGLDGLKCTFNTGSYPYVSLTEASPQDWSQWDALLVDIQNTESRVANIFLRVDWDTRADGFNFCRTASINIQKAETVTVAFPLRIVPMDLAMRTLPPIGNTKWMADNQRPLTLTNILSWRFYMEFPQFITRIMVRNPRLVRAEGLTNQIVDPFGQFTRADWDNKVHSVEELIAKDKAEELALAKEQAEDPISDEYGLGRDRFGGWIDGPEFPATGRFRTTFHRGRWWFVTPDGFPFISFGMGGMDIIDLPTIANPHRTQMFEWLPPMDGEPLSDHYYPVTGVFGGPFRDGWAYNFFTANLERKYGQDWLNRSHIRSIDRMKSWGFNTIGAFSSEELWFMRRRVPYTAFTKINGSHHRIPMANGATMHDPYDPVFRTSLNTSLTVIAPFAAYDEYCVGWFIDNEPGWANLDGEESGRYTLVYQLLQENMAQSPAKQVLINDLRAIYGTITAFNTAWGYNLTSWEQLEAPISLSQSNSTSLRRFDIRTFITKFAREYFSIVKQALREVDPDALYLGCRFYRSTKEVMEAAALNADVLSFNAYGDTVPLRFFYPDIAYLQKPFMMGEFHFGATDRGMFNPGLAPAFDQKDRSRRFTMYVNSVVDNKAFIGCHWFQYIDQPLIGRMFDGENYNNGFVSIADVPYPELVSAAKETFKGAYFRRWMVP